MCSLAQVPTVFLFLLLHEYKASSLKMFRAGQQDWIGRKWPETNFWVFFLGGGGGEDGFLLCCLLLLTGNKVRSFRMDHNLCM